MFQTVLSEGVEQGHQNYVRLNIGLTQNVTSFLIRFS